MSISLVLPKVTNAATWRGAITRLASRWLLLVDYGDPARRNMAIAWCCVGTFFAADIAWLGVSPLSMARPEWTAILKACLYGILLCGFFLVVAYRLREPPDRVGAVLKTTLHRTEALFSALILLAAIGSGGLVFSYLATAADWPLQDAALAQVDRTLGFDWLTFLAGMNSRPTLAALLIHAYQSVLFVTEGVLVWLALSGRGERLAEFLAVLCLSSVGVGAGMLLAPAAGAFAYFKPAPELYGNFGAAGEMWPFFKTFAALRDGSLSVIDMSAAQGIVSFPSFHTVLGIITAYALRETRWLFVPVLLLNAVMIVSTLPVGGHHLADVIAGAVISVGAILIVRIRAA